MNTDKDITLQIDCAYFKTLKSDGEGGYTTENFIGLESYEYMERFNNGGCSGFIGENTYIAVYPDHLYFEFESEEELIESLNYIIDYAYPSIGWECLRT